VAKEKRSLYNMVFGNKPRQPDGQATQLKLLNGYTPYFSQFGNDAYASDVVRSAVDAIARNTAKLKPRHIRKISGKVFPQDSNIQRLLEIQPNPYMDSYSFYYKVITQLYMQNNAFVYIALDKNADVTGFYPINAITTEFMEYGGEIFAKFLFMSGEYITVPYTQLIHLRRFFYKDDIFGENNDYALYPTLELINTTNQGIINAIKTSAFIRGILSFTQLLKRQDKKDRTQDFMADYMNISNNGGVASVDGSMEYKELKNDPKMVDDKQMDIIQKKVYDYFGISKEIINSSYNEEQWNSFYSSTLEPLAIQISLQFTSKLFSNREKGFGNEIIFSASRLTYASNQTKVNMARDLLPLGLFTINEMREIFELEPVEDGGKRIISLNYIDASKANQYQVGDKGGDKNVESNPKDSTEGN
jgi:HK97 family phage portal protein